MGRAPLSVVVCAALLMAGGAAAEAKSRQRPFPEGLYGNVDVSEQTGDLGGFEVRFYTDPATGKPMAEFVLCEGWCNTVVTAEVTRTVQGFAFSHVETLEAYDDGGNHAPQNYLVEYQVIPAGKGWKLRLLYDGTDVTQGKLWRIKPLDRPFGIDVARRQEEAEAP
jgi:hypothetical protein